MANLNVAFYTAQTGLFTNQKRLSVTSNNVANLQKPGYHRQTVNVQNMPPVDTPQGQFGTGSHVISVVRNFDLALETSLRQATSQYGYEDIYSDHINYLEGALAPNAISDLASAVQDFADAIQHVATRPEAVDARNEFLSTAQTLANQFNTDYATVTNLRDSIADSSGNGIIANKITDFNSMVEQINDLNQKIANAEARLFNPPNANDLRDQRDQLVLELSELTDLSVTEESNGGYTITVGGHTLVDGTAYTYDSLQLDMSGGTPVYQWNNGGSPTAATITEGQLAGLADAWNYQNSYASDLWNFATNFATAVNTEHANGYDLNDNAGANVFDASTPGAMSLLLSDPDTIAAASTSGEHGDGSNMTSMWDTLNTGGYLEKPDTLTDSVALEAQTASVRAETAKDARQLFTDAIQSTSGVNIDEEMMDMLEAQRAFQASSKVVSIIDNMLGTAIQMI